MKKEISFSTLTNIRVIERIMADSKTAALVDICNQVLNEQQLDVFTRFFGIGTSKQGLDCIAEAVDCQTWQVKRMLEESLNAIRTHSWTMDLFLPYWSNAKKKIEEELDAKWNTVNGSALYYMNGRFCVNRNPYAPDTHAPQKGIPYDHDNTVHLDNISDFHSTAIVLGQGEKRGLFVCELIWGMQGFRYSGLCLETPFPYDEIRFCKVENDGKWVGLFACREDKNWEVYSVGGGKTFNGIKKVIPVAPDFDAVQEMTDYFFKTETPKNWQIV